MKLHATFLCISTNLEPEVHALSAGDFDKFNERMRIADKRQSAPARQQAFRVTFGKAFDYAIPCWSQEAMERLALDYKGVHAERVCHLAASIALGETYGADEGATPPDVDGGTKVMAAPKPTPKRPGGAAVSLSDMFASAAR